MSRPISDRIVVAESVLTPGIADNRTINAARKGGSPSSSF